MRFSRISLALEDGALSLPETGPIAVFRPQGSDDLGALPKDRVRVIQGFRPDHDALAGRGFSVATEAGGPYAAALVCLPRAKAEARALVAEAVAHVPEGALVMIDGQKTDGVDSMLRDCRARVSVGDPVSKAHGKLFWFAAPRPDVFADWRAEPHVIDGGFRTVPGVFSEAAIDRGSALLAAALPARMPRRVVDLGAGWGVLSRAVLAREGVEVLHLVEAEKASLDCARVNVTDSRAEFHWADATKFSLPGPVDAVVMNPPFHVSREGDPRLGAEFILAASRLLAPGGTLWMVANRHLPYEKVLSEAFREIEEIGGDGAFKLTRAARPVPARQAPKTGGGLVRGAGTHRKRGPHA